MGAKYKHFAKTECFSFYIGYACLKPIGYGMLPLMSMYDETADTLREFDFCEGCPFVRKCLNDAYDLDHPEAPPSSDASKEEKGSYRLSRMSAKAAHSFELHLAKFVGDLHAEFPCEGSVSTRLIIPKQFEDSLSDLAEPYVSCEVYERHRKAASVALKQSLSRDD